MPLSINLRPWARAGTREFPLENSREFPVKFISHSIPRIFSVSREFSGNIVLLYFSRICSVFYLFLLLLRLRMLSVAVLRCCSARCPPKACVATKTSQFYVFLTKYFRKQILHGKKTLKVQKVYQAVGRYAVSQ